MFVLLHPEEAARVNEELRERGMLPCRACSQIQETGVATVRHRHDRPRITVLLVFLLTTFGSVAALLAYLTGLILMHRPPGWQWMTPLCVVLCGLCQLGFAMAWQDWKRGEL